MLAPFWLEDGDMGERPKVAHSDPEIMGGTPVFVGTRVPLRNLIDYLEGDYSLDDFPSVTREQAVAVLESAHDVLATHARSSG